MDMPRPPGQPCEQTHSLLNRPSQDRTHAAVAREESREETDGKRDQIEGGREGSGGYEEVIEEETAQTERGKTRRGGET